MEQMIGGHKGFICVEWQKLGMCFLTVLHH